MKENHNPPSFPTKGSYTVEMFQLRRGPNGLLPPTQSPRLLQPLSALNPTRNLSEEENKISTLEAFINTAVNAQLDAIRFLQNPENVKTLFQKLEDVLFAIE